jgi:hypothetical protein
MYFCVRNFVSLQLKSINKKSYMNKGEGKEVKERQNGRWKGESHRRREGRKEPQGRDREQREKRQRGKDIGGETKELR